MIEKMFRQFNTRSPIILLLVISLLLVIPTSLFLELPEVTYLKKMKLIEQRIMSERVVLKTREEDIRAQLMGVFWGEVLRMHVQIEGKLSKDVLAHLLKESRYHQIPADILLHLLRIESNFDPHAIGPETRYGRAYGLAQFMENTAPWVAEMASLDYDIDLLFDPYYSITLAATYLHFLQYGDGNTHIGFDDWHATLTAYNRGMAGLNQYYKRNQTSISSYSEAILSSVPTGL